MLFCLAWVFNFLWGGISGVFNSDVPSDVTTHGSFFVMAHFHYTIMGGLIFAFFAAIYYWVPKMYGFKFNEKLAKIHFWVMFIAFNSTFAPLFALGFMGMPRRVVTYNPAWQGLNDWVSGSAYVLGVSMLVFLANVVWSLVIKREPAEANPWHSKSAEFQLPTPVPVHDFDRIPVFDADPYPYGVEPVPAGVAAPATGAPSRWKPQHLPPEHGEPEPRAWQPRAIWVGGRMLCGSITFFFASFVFAYFYLDVAGRQPQLEDRPGSPLTGAGGRGDGAVPDRRGRLPAGGEAARGRRPAAGIIVIVFSLLAVALQFFEYTTLDFGAASRRLRSGVLRLDRDVCDRRAARDLLGRDAGRQPVAGSPQRRTGAPRSRRTRRICSGPGSRRRPSTGRTSSRSASSPTSSSTSSEHEPQRLVAGPVARIRGAGGLAVRARQPRAETVRTPCARSPSSPGC